MSAIGPETSELKHITREYAHAGLWNSKWKSKKYQNSTKTGADNDAMNHDDAGFDDKDINKHTNDGTSGTSCASNGGVGESLNTVLSI